MYSDNINTETIEIVHEEPDEGGDSYKVLLKVSDRKTWSKCVVQMLEAQEGAEFGVSVRKEYYLHEGAPSYIWVLLIWGDLEDAQLELLPILNYKAPAKTNGTAVKAVPPTTSSQIKRKVYQTADGPRAITTVALPHYRGPRTADPGTVKKMGQKGFGATVTNLNASEL